MVKLNKKETSCSYSFKYPDTSWLLSDFLFDTVDTSFRDHICPPVTQEFLEHRSELCLYVKFKMC